MRGACFKDVDNAADQLSSVSEVQLNPLVSRVVEL